MNDNMLLQVKQILQNSRHKNLNIPDGIEIMPKDDYINDLCWLAASNVELLADILAAFQYEAFGFEQVYGVDFDIIYTYANPWSHNSSHSNLVNYLIEKDNVKLTLLPGTIEEYMRYVKYIQDNQEKVDEVLYYLGDGGDSIPDKAIEAIFAICNVTNGDELKSKLDDFLNPNIKERLKLLAINTKYRNRYIQKRLEYILDLKRLVPYSELFQDIPDELLDKEVFSSINNKLVALRMGQRYKYNNAFDALNLATIVNYDFYQANNLNNKRTQGAFLRLLTNTDSIFKASLSEYNHMLGQYVNCITPAQDSDIHHSLAIRSCYEAVCSSIYSKHYTDINKKINMVNLDYSLMSFLKTKLHNISRKTNQYKFRSSMADENYTLNYMQAMQQNHSLQNYNFGKDELKDKDIELLKNSAEYFLMSPIHSDIMDILILDCQELNLKSDMIRYNNEYQSFLNIKSGNADITFKQFKQNLSNMVSDYSNVDKSSLWWKNKTMSSLINKKYSSITKNNLIKSGYIEELLSEKPSEALNSPEDSLARFGFQFRVIEEENTFNISVKNIFKVRSEEVLSIAYDGEFYFFTWPLYYKTNYSLDEIFSLVDHLFNKRTGIFNSKIAYQGELYAVMSNGERHCICPLPVANSFKNRDNPIYFDFYASKITGAGESPAFLQCDTDICTVRLGMMILGHRPGIIITVQKTSYLDNIMKAFAATYPWSDYKQFEPMFASVVKNRIQSLNKKYKGESQYDYREFC